MKACIRCLVIALNVVTISADALSIRRVYQAGDPLDFGEKAPKQRNRSFLVNTNQFNQTIYAANGTSVNLTCPQERFIKWYYLGNDRNPNRLLLQVLNILIFH
ncbi:unnamed protein product [Brassicogethes aeneus]|uniref:Uncharacterized protein n=1 Tax=Brassicogethes aeneus TaxID=1431903 RepID=A0A9P0B6C2_BRAAE|nr:unnamed protein product [Brassicogethes aeneus]